MSNLRRFHREGNIYFITNVTYNRKKILIEDTALFWQSLKGIKQKQHFELIAWVIIPDHYHLIIDPQGHDISNIIQRIKMSFAALYRGKKSLKSGRIWQNRFWDHVIRNQLDMNRHIDYIHYNPVRHGLVKSPFAWRESSLHEYGRKGYYPPDWGQREALAIEGYFGE